MRWMLIVFIVWFSASPSQAASALIPLEYFTRPDEFGDIKISPDGKFLAFTTGKNGRTQLVCAALGDSKSAGGIRMPDKYEISEFHWVSPTQLVYFTNRARFGEMQPRLSAELFSVDHRCQTPRKIYGFQTLPKTTGTKLAERPEEDEATPRFLGRLPSSPDTVLITEHPWRKRDSFFHNDPDAVPRVVRLDTQSGQRKSLGIVPLAGARVLVDHDTVVRFAVGRKDAVMQMLWRADADADWQILDVPQLLAETVEPLAFTADGAQILLSAVAPEGSYAALYQLDPVQRKGALVHAFAAADVGTVVRDLAGSGAIVGVASAADEQMIHWLDDAHPTARLYQGLQRAFPKQSISITSASADGAVAIVLVSSDVDPGSYFIFDAKRMRAEFLRAARAWIDPTVMRPRRAVELAARDGLKLHGYVTEPLGKGPFPMVVIPHDGAMRDTGFFDSTAQLLASRGYAVLQVDYRGSSGYGRQFAAAGNGEWGARMQDDVTDATRWAIEQGVAREGRACILGQGYGGYAALMGAVREPKLYRCAIGFGGYYDLELLAADSDFSFAERRFVQQALGSDAAVLRARSPVHNAQRIEVPVLMIHGDQDSVAGYEHAQRMRMALRKHSKPVDLMTLKGESHDLYDEQTRRQVYERVVGFLATHLRQ